MDWLPDEIEDLKEIRKFTRESIDMFNPEFEKHLRTLVEKVKKRKNQYLYNKMISLVLDAIASVIAEMGYDPYDKD